MPINPSSKEPLFMSTFTKIRPSGLLRAAAVPALLLTCLSASAQSFSPWLPIPGTGSVGLGFVSQSADNAYVLGDTEAPLSAITEGGGSQYKRESLSLRLGYGISDALSIDATLASTKVGVGGADNSSGLDDSAIGLNWRVVDEFSNRSLPTVTLRVAGILGGDYNGARLAAIGKDASGYQLAASVGRQVTPALSVWGSLGFEDRNNGVPNATFADVSAAYAVTPSLSLSVGYSAKRFDGSLDIAGPGFSPAAFQQVREERDTVRLGIAYALAGNQSISLNYGKLVKGNNTVKDDQIVGVGYGIGF